jgi:hypothetical protein
MYFVALSRDRSDGLETRLANRLVHLEFRKPIAITSRSAGLSWLPMVSG